jgi:GT2 family glycosyltransferase
MNQPLVSIITVNYNQSAITCELLASLQKITYPNIEIWVVDNASEERIKFLIKSNFPQVKVIESNENLGFAGGNNLAIKEAQGEFLMFLNNDTEVAPDFLEPLVETMLSNPKIGICASKIHFFYTPNIIQFAGSSALHPYKIQSFSVGYGEKDKGQYDTMKPTYLAHGAGMMVRKEAIRKVGLMPEIFFLYYEEIDWCEQIKKAGYEIYFVPQSLILHKESVSVGKESTIQIYYKTRNRILLARRWRKGIGKLLSLTYLGLVAIRDLLNYLFHRKYSYFRTYWQAILWNLKENSTESF